MEATEVEADPKNLRASAELYNEDQSLRADVYIFMPQPDGRPTPVTSHSDQFMKDMHANDLEAFEEESESVTEREISTKNMEWKCIDGEGTQDDGKIDHATCLATFAGRVVDAQRLVLHEERDQDNKQLEVVLEKIDAALSTLKWPAITAGLVQDLVFRLGDGSADHAGGPMRICSPHRSESVNLLPRICRIVHSAQVGGSNGAGSFIPQ